MPLRCVMNKKFVALTVCLILAVSVGLVVAQETGFFINITNSSGSINTALTNSTVIENVTLTNGTLTLNINADNISTVNINGINYTAQPTQPYTAGAPAVTITYYGENSLPPQISQSEVIPQSILDASTGQTVTDFTYYAWNITLVNVFVVNSPNNIGSRLLQPLVAENPTLLTMQVGRNSMGLNPEDQTAQGFFVSYNANTAKYVLVLFARTQLSSEEINSLTNDLNTLVAQALLEWYS